MKELTFVELQTQYGETCSIDMANKIVCIIHNIKISNKSYTRTWEGTYKNAEVYLSLTPSIKTAIVETYSNQTKKRIAVLEKLGFNVVAKCECESFNKENPNKIYLVVER